MSRITIRQCFLCAMFLIVSDTIVFSQTFVNEGTPGGGVQISDSTMIFNQKINNKKEGWWKQSFLFSPNRTRKVSYYKNGLKNGKEYIFYFNGEIKVDGQFQYGKRNGDFTYYERNIRKDGIRTGNFGKFRTYYNGELIQKGDINSPP